MGSMPTSGNLGDEMVTTLAQNAGDVGSILALGAIFPVFITPTTLHAFFRQLSEPRFQG